MTKSNLPQPFARVLAADATLAAWTAKHAREERLLHVVRRLLPRPVAERVLVADASGDVLELSTSAGAIAAVVRQKSADLLVGLGRDGWQFTGIRVRVQPRTDPVAPAKRVPPQWDNRAKPPLARLAASLPDGELKRALTRLLRTRGG